MMTATKAMSVPLPTNVLSKDRVEPGSVNIPVGELPPAVTSEPLGCPDEIATALINALNKALVEKDHAAISQLFIEQGYWRDHLGLSWDYHTFKGRDRIAQCLADGIRLSNVHIDRSSKYRAPHFGWIDGGIGEVKGLEFFITFTNDVGSGRGVARVAQERDGQWRFFTLFTSLSELNGHEESLNTRRPQGVEHGGKPDRKNWQERRDAEAELDKKDPKVLIIGAGQGGLTAAARLKMLNVETLVIDREDRIGDNWRRRYHQLVLHDPVWFDHLPLIPFPVSWPVFTPKDKLAEFFEAYAKLLELNVWTKTTLTSSSWDETKKQWTVTLEKQKADGSVESRTFHPNHVILATGHSGKKNFPSIKGMESFQGDRLCHSSEYDGANPDAQGKKAVIVGCCNSGHDIAQDFCEKGYDVTMVQRSSTCVISSSSNVHIGLKGLYEEGGPPHEDADLWLWGMPSEVFKRQQIHVNRLQNKYDANILEGLAKVGFKLDKGPNEAGLFMKYFQRGGGYYIDVGASQLIIDGKIKIKQGQEISQILPHGIEFADGTRLDADEIIFATGYQNMRTEARSILGDEVADRIGNVWGLDEEGEFRTIWRRSGHPGFWYMGGNLALCRYYSRLLALQIKALEEGIARHDST